MLATGRGSIALVQYSGDEAAPEIKKLLDAVVSHCQPPHTALRVPLMRLRSKTKTSSSDGKPS
jgi:hypothetical protein